MTPEHDAALAEREAFERWISSGSMPIRYGELKIAQAAWEARSAIAQHRAQEWQPIETAPKDGSEVLVWREDCGVLIARYTFAGEFLTYRELEGMDDHDIWEPDWFCADFVSGSRLEGSEVPTHWQPIPAAPLNKDATA